MTSQNSNIIPEAIPLNFFIDITRGEGVGISNPDRIREIALLKVPPNDLASLETYNLIKGWEHLNKLLIETKEYAKDRYFADYAGLLETHYIILDVHKLLLKDIAPHAGHFTTSKRFTIFHGYIYQYPQFTTVALLEDGFLYLLDRINIALSAFKKTENTVRKNDMLLTLASKFFFTFLTIHPFADSNGRTARLILGYLLHVGYNQWITIKPSTALTSTLVQMRQALNLPCIINTQEEMLSLINYLLSCDVNPIKHLIEQSIKQPNIY